MPNAPTVGGPAYANPMFISQGVSTPAELISGITAYDLDSRKLNTAWIVSNADIRYRWDGGSPTTAEGHILAAKTPLLLRGKKNILNFRFLGDGGSAAIVAITLDDSARGGGIV